LDCIQFDKNDIKESFDIEKIRDIYILTESRINVAMRYLARNVPFIQFVEYCGYDYIKRMLDTKDIDINYIDELNKTALDYSYYNCDEKISNLLKEYKAKRGCELRNEKCE